MKVFTNLNELLSELNKPIILDEGTENEETLKSVFDFKVVVEEDHIKIFDANESYSIDYEEDMNCMMHLAAEEFGAKYEYINDEIFSKIEFAIQKDLQDEELILEWENNVVMIAYYQGFQNE